MLIGAAAMLNRIPEVLSKIEVDNNILNRAKVAKNPGLATDQNFQ